MVTKNLDKYTKLSILVLIIGILIRFYLASIYHVAGDACWQLSNSRFIAENMKLPLFEQFGRDEPFWPPPLFHIIAAFVYVVFNNFGANIANFAVRMISPILGSLTLVLFFFISRMLFNKKTAFYALLFLTFIPLHLDYGVFSYIDGPLTFLATLSVYLALKNKPIGSSITAGLAILTKYNGVFILPVLLYIFYINKKNKSNVIKNLLIATLVPIFISLAWFIRNWIYLGNPIWPFMNSVFHGVEIKTFAETSVGAVNILNIFNPNAITSLYLGVFGVPDGNINTLNFFDIPYMGLLFAIWLIATIIFSIPFIIGITSKKLKHKKLLLIWILSYIAVVLLYVVNASWSVTRFLLPAFPAVALIWAHGIEKIKFLTVKKIVVSLITLIIIGFVFTSFLKISLASKAWNFYKEDFEWVKSNTEKESTFMTQGQCISYNIERQTVYPAIENLANADYVFVNQDFRLDHRAKFENELLTKITEKSTPIYKNEITKTIVYKIKR